jgi:hypothetical protein
VTVVVVAAFSAACSSSHRSTTAATSSSTTALSTTVAAATQKVSVTPDTGLRSGQSVEVSASGFTPGEALVVTECADKGNATGQGDCDLSNVVNATANNSGQISTTYKVTAGPFGANHIVCSATQKCEISVSQVNINPIQVGTADITFAG